MRTSLADKLKELRKAKKVSQEKFAEYLGVSYQAVSKWENGITSPDITLLPDIARYFGITVDELLQVEQIDEDKYYEECLAKSENIFRNNMFADRVPLWEEAYKKSPNDIRVKEMLMSAYFDSDKIKYQKEIVELGTEIYNTSFDKYSNTYFQGQAIKQIACTYYENGNKDKAIEWSQRAHQIIHCQELLTMQISDDIEWLKEIFSFSNYCLLDTLFLMTQRLGVLNYTNNLGKDYAKNIYLTVTKIFELVYPNDDMGFETLRCLCGLHQNNAEFEISSSNDEILVKKHITRAVECAIKSVSIESHDLTHPLLFGWHIDEAPSNKTQIVKDLRRTFEHITYDEYRNKIWFVELLRKLANYE